jgi:hypothetical protein
MAIAQQADPEGAGAGIEASAFGSEMSQTWSLNFVKKGTKAVARECIMSGVQQDQLVCHLTITRTPSDNLQQREVIAALDGEEIARLMDGESVTREISPGRHRLCVDNTWNRKTVEFDVAPDEHPKFFVTNRAGSLSQFFKFTFGGAPTYVEIQRLS